MLIILVILLLIFLVVSYSSSPKSPPAVSKQGELTEMSKSLATPEQTPQLKAKLEDMSKSLNKK